MSPADNSARSERHLLGRPGFLGASLVLVTLGLASALAYQAMTAASSHRAAVEAALSHHASTAAWRFAREARGWVGYGMEEAGGALQRETISHAVLQGPELVQSVLAEKYCDCMTAAFGRTFVRVVLGKDAKLDLVGEPLSQRSRDDLRAQMVAFAADIKAAQRMTRWRILPPGSPRLNRGTDVALLWRVNDKWQKARAIYGMIVEREQIERPLIGALENAQFFPPLLVPPMAAKGLVRIEVAGANRATLFTRGPETDRFAGKDTLGADYGDMIATATINPAAAQSLVAGGLPPSRVPMIISLLVLALSMGVGAALLLRRTYRLAQLREDFVSGVSHELRTPLTQIRMHSELLATEGFKSPSERSRAVDVIHREALRLTNLVDNILEFARLRRTQVVPEASAVSLSDVAREVSDALAPILESQGNKLDLVATESVEILGDRDSVIRILRNLVENAVKYGPVGQTVRLTLTRNGGGTARVLVDDEGPGIPVTERENVWQPYYRLDRDRNTKTGSGLGLSVVADLVQALGGRVSVGDAPGKGARFTVDLPAAS
jgi:signal transduction histidine kinase